MFIRPQMKNDPNKLPHRYSETSVSRFITTINTAMDKHPDILVVSAGGYSLETFSNRLRDAMKSLKEGYCVINGFDVTRLRSLYNDLSVGIRGDKIIIGSRENVKSFGKKTPEVSFIDQIMTSVTSLSVKDPTWGVLESLLTLHNEGILTSPTKILTTNARPQPDVLQRFPNIAIVDDADGYTIL